jgi:hypothetical protein
MPFQKGRKKTGGRRKGGPYHRLPEDLRQKFQDFVAAGRTVSPLDCMLGVMQVRIDQGEYDLALAAAEKAAPYCHAKLAMSEVRVQHSTDRSDSEIAADIAALRAKLEAARSLPAPPVTIDVTAESIHVDLSGTVPLDDPLGSPIFCREKT